MKSERRQAQVQAYRWREVPEFQVGEEHDAQVNRINIEGASNRNQQRRLNHNRRVDFGVLVRGECGSARGENVAAGATLLVIDNPELVAELGQAKAEKTVADAELQRINVGTRPEIIAQRKAEIDRAASGLTRPAAGDLRRSEGCSRQSRAIQST